MLFVKQKTAYEMRISDWSSDVCSSDLLHGGLDAADIADQLVDREVLAQQHLVADHQRLDGIRIFVGEPDRRDHFGLVDGEVGAEPDALHDADAVAAGFLWHDIEAFARRVGAHAAGDAMHADRKSKRLNSSR